MQSDPIPLLEQIHWLDVALVGLIALAALVGFWRGAVPQVLRLLKIVGAACVALYCHEPVQGFLASVLNQAAPTVPDFLAYLYAFLTAYLILFIVGRILRIVLHRLGVPLSIREIRDTLTAAGLRPLDRVLGACLSGLTWTVILGGCLLALGQRIGPEVEVKLAGSWLRPKLVGLTEQALKAIPPERLEELKGTLGRFEATVVRWTGPLFGRDRQQAARTSALPAGTPPVR